MCLLKIVWGHKKCIKELRLGQEDSLTYHPQRKSMHPVYILNSGSIHPTSRRLAQSRQLLTVQLYIWVVAVKKLFKTTEWCKSQDGGRIRACHPATGCNPMCTECVPWVPRRWCALSFVPCNVRLPRVKMRAMHSTLTHCWCTLHPPSLVWQIPFIRDLCLCSIRTQATTQNIMSLTKCLAFHQYVTLSEKFWCIHIPRYDLCKKIKILFFAYFSGILFQMSKIL